MRNQVVQSTQQSEQLYRKRMVRTNNLSELFNSQSHQPMKLKYVPRQPPLIRPILKVQAQSHLNTMALRNDYDLPYHNRIGSNLYYSSRLQSLSLTSRWMISAVPSPKTLQVTLMLLKSYVLDFNH
jgi:hypothetical protein